jgi:hypothetical protein
MLGFKKNIFIPNKKKRTYFQQKNQINIIFFFSTKISKSEYFFSCFLMRSGLSLPLLICVCALVMSFSSPCVCMCFGYISFTSLHVCVLWAFVLLLMLVYVLWVFLLCFLLMYVLWVCLFPLPACAYALGIPLAFPAYVCTLVMSLTLLFF